MIIVFGGVKGGASKTTNAVNAAAMRVTAERERVLLVDADKSQTANIWAYRRMMAKVRPEVYCETMRGVSIAQQLLKRAEQGFDIIVDCGGHDSIELRMALAVADKLIVPTRPNQLDLDVYPALKTIVDEALTQNPKLQQFVMLAQVEPKAESRKRAEVAEFLTKYPAMRLMDSITTMRATYAHCQGNGLAVCEFATKREIALKEMQKLNEELWI